MKLVAAVTLTLLTLASPASASSGIRLVNADGTPVGGELQAWADSALLQLPGFTVTVNHASAPLDGVYPAWADPNGSGIYVTAQVTRGELLHEIGHEYDYHYLTDPDRAALMRFVLHLSGPWHEPADSPHEQFAEAFRIAAMHRTLHPGWLPPGQGGADYAWEGNVYVGTYDVHLTAATLALLREWLVNIPRR